MNQVIDILKKIKNENLSIGVAVEGGGLRGVISLAMLSVLKDFGLSKQIQGVSGTSSGAINAAYFVANQLEEALPLYREMASPEFIQPLKWPNAMNLDYLFNDRISNHHKINTKRLMDATVDFHITATCTKDGRTETHVTNQMKNESQVLQTLRASASAPLFTTNCEIIDGTEYNDGHVQMAIPYQPLLKYDLDYILCLQTQKRGYKKKEGFLGRLHRTLAARKYNKAYKQSLQNSKALYNNQLEEIENLPNLISLQIEPEDFMVSKMCKDPSHMDHCYESTRARFLSSL